MFFMKKGDVVICNVTLSKIEKNEKNMSDESIFLYEDRVIPTHSKAKMDIY